MIWRKRSLSVVLFLLFGALSGPAPAAAIPDPLKPLHVISRLGFGSDPGQVEKIQTMGIEKYIAAQLAPDSIPESDKLTRQLNELKTLGLNPAQLFQEYGPPRAMRGQKPDPEAIKAARERARAIVQEAARARLLRAIESPRQLQEVMVDFWFNHFNVFADKGLDQLWVGAYEREAIRPFALGRFYDLLSATAHHPAMLFYLDNWQNTAPNSPGARGKLQGVNENYARELMELHTLGVNGGYTQTDVVALAHILTGWGLQRPQSRAKGSQGFYFDAKRHDFSDKIFLSRPIKGGGLAEGEEALAMLARHPATARHISNKLAQYFVADEPPAGFVERLSKAFIDSDGNIRTVLNTLFHSPEFWEQRYYGHKFKTPYHYVVSAVRASGLSVNNTQPLNGILRQLGMPLYGCLTPDGYKNTEQAWLNPDAMMRRLSFVTVLANGRLPLSNQETVGPAGVMSMVKQPSAETPSVDVLQLTRALPGLSAQTQAAIDIAPASLRAALMLGSPEFMRY
ncbi:MAG TPA: DUF1800 domain-containing protein [Acidiferrobacterales bacterium]|nr:DUF1800 domain-containing protein [Acidiferrobacterales bacterium]